MRERLGILAEYGVAKVMSLLKFGVKAVTAKIGTIIPRNRMLDIDDDLKQKMEKSIVWAAKLSLGQLQKFLQFLKNRSQRYLKSKRKRNQLIGLALVWAVASREQAVKEGGVNHL